MADQQSGSATHKKHGFATDGHLHQLRLRGLTAYPYVPFCVMAWLLVAIMLDKVWCVRLNAFFGVRRTVLSCPPKGNPMPLTGHADGEEQGRSSIASSCRFACYTILEASHHFLFLGSDLRPSGARQWRGTETPCHVYVLAIPKIALFSWAGVSPVSTRVSRKWLILKSPLLSSNTLFFNEFFLGQAPRLFTAVCTISPHRGTGSR